MIRDVIAASKAAYKSIPCIAACRDTQEAKVRYQKAEDILPAELLAQIQKYADGIP